MPSGGATLGGRSGGVVRGRTAPSGVCSTTGACDLDLVGKLRSCLRPWRERRRDPEHPLPCQTRSQSGAIWARSWSALRCCMDSVGLLTATPCAASQLARFVDSVPPDSRHEEARHGVASHSRGVSTSARLWPQTSLARIAFRTTGVCAIRLGRGVKLLPAQPTATSSMVICWAIEILAKLVPLLSNRARWSCRLATDDPHNRHPHGIRLSFPPGRWKKWITTAWVFSVAYCSEARCQCAVNFAG